jgi:hypothetical protein
MEEIGNANKFLVGNPEGKTSLGRPSCRREDDIRTEIVWECVKSH